LGHLKGGARLVVLEAVEQKETLQKRFLGRGGAGIFKRCLAVVCLLGLDGKDEEAEAKEERGKMSGRAHGGR
jgi:hypothetical protein